MKKKLHQVVGIPTGMITHPCAYGIEVETEMNQSFDMDMIKPTSKDYWRWEYDGSLKLNGIEWVTHRPLKPEEITEALFDLEQLIKLNGLSIRDSMRAGVHIHINVQQWTLDKLIRFFVIYNIFETAVVRQCGLNRENNLFCLRTSDAPAVLMIFEDFVRGWNISKIQTNSLRYAALNLQSLFKFGTLEFRALRTSKDFKYEVPFFISVFEHIEKAAEELNDCWSLLASVSGFGGEKIFEDVFKNKPEFDRLKYSGYEHDIYHNLQNMQDLLDACRDRGL